jgi:hypothetical protein
MRIPELNEGRERSAASNRSGRLCDYCKPDWVSFTAQRVPPQVPEVEVVRVLKYTLEAWPLVLTLSQMMPLMPPG